jgi:hypothetical protein
MRREEKGSEAREDLTPTIPSLLEASRLLRAGELSPVELTTACLESGDGPNAASFLNPEHARGSSKTGPPKRAAR